jgi:hypothetical protein
VTTSTSNTNTTQQGTTSGTNTPVQQGQIESTFGQLGTATGEAAGLTPAQLQAINDALTGSTGSTNAATGALTNAGATTTGIGTGALSAGATGLENFNATNLNNPAALTAGANQIVAGENIPQQVLQSEVPAIQAANEVTMPAIASNAAATGNINSSGTQNEGGLVQQGLAENTQNLDASLTGQAFTNAVNTEENAAQSNNTLNAGALSTLESGGTNAVGTGTGATAAAPALQQSEAGLVPTLTSAQTSSILAPFLAELTGLSTNAGGSTTGTFNSTGTSDTTSSPSALSIIGSLLGTGGSLLGSTGSNGVSTGLGGATGISNIIKAL